MKARLAILALLAGVALVPPRARTEAPSPPATIRADMQMVSVSPAAARQLIPAFEDSKTAPDAWTHLQEMIGSGEAKLIAWPIVCLQSGARADAGSFVEQRYPTEFNFPSGVSSFAPLPTLTPTWIPTTPTGFETRNVGVTFEVQAWVEAEGQVIDLRLVSQFVRPAGFQYWRSQKSPLGSYGLQQQPYFQTANVTTQMHVHRGQPALAGVFVFAEPEPHVELHILHARATLLPPSAPTFPTSTP